MTKTPEQTHHRDDCHYAGKTVDETQGYPSHCGCSPELIDQMRESLEGCAHGCGPVEPYGFVIAAGCPDHEKSWPNLRPRIYVAPSSNVATPPARCCHVNGLHDDCPALATWELTVAPGSPDDVLQSCDQHVADLLGGSAMLDATPIGEPSVDTLEVVFDGPPGPEGPRFVEVEAHYGREPQSRPLPSVAGDGLVWMDRGDGTWALRVRVPGGRLLG